MRLSLLQRLFLDFLVILEINITSTIYFYLAVYLFNLRNKVQKLDKEKLGSLNFKSRLSEYQQLLEVPTLKEIEIFELEKYLNDKKINFFQKRKLNQKFNFEMEGIDNIEAKKETETKISESDDLRIFPHEQCILKFYEYFKFYQNTFRSIFENDETLPKSIKYYFSIMVRSKYIIILLLYIYILITFSNLSNLFLSSHLLIPLIFYYCIILIKILI